MAWTTPRTWVTGEIATASFLNVHVRDNLAYLLASGAMTAMDFPATCDPRSVIAVSPFAVANHCHYNRVYVGGTLSKIRVRVGTASGNIAVAVYNQTGSGLTAAPSARQATSGAVVCPAAGSADVSLGGSVTIGHATHWFALSADNIVATFYHCGTIPASWTNGVNAAQAAAHPPPANAVPAVLASYLHALVGVP